MLALVRDELFLPTLQDIEEPQITDATQVKIRIIYGTLCRDDMRSQDELNFFSRTGVVGHEASGIIVEAGTTARDNGFGEGTRVSLMPIDFCGRCKFCLSRVPQYCPEVSLTDGAFAEYVVKRYFQLARIPDDLTYTQANLMEPVGDILEALSKIQLNYSSKVLLIGAGFTGLIFIQLLRLFGIEHITVVEPLADRRDLALSFGVDSVLSAADPGLSLKLLQESDFCGFDVAIDTSAHENIIEFAIPALQRGGTMLMFAYSDSQSKISFQSLDVYTRNISVIWSCICGIQSMENAAPLIRRLSLEKLITAEYPLSLAAKAFSDYLNTNKLKIGIRFPN